MSNQSSSNLGGAAIKPSARRSIHSYRQGYSPFVQGEAMGRYGLENGNLRSESLQRGTDEVDNIMSKPLRTFSPSPRKRKVPERRKSYTNDYSQELTSEDNSLSKSLPANFQTYYSDDNYYDPNGDSWRHDSSNGSYNDSTPYHASMPIQEDLRETEQSDAQQNGLSSTKNVFFGVLVGIICVILAAYHVVETKPKHVMYDKITFSTDLHNVGKKYNVGGDSILKVQSGIVTIVDREDTGSFIFVYNSKSRNFQENILDSFINEIASTTAKILRNDSAEVRHIVLESSDLNMRSHNEFMNTYRDEVDKTGVLLVKELENVPSNLAMAFHYYCDEYNPLVKKSAIFFTMDLGDCSSYNGQDSSNAVIEKCLSTKWQNVPQANIAPLLTRVVGVVVDVSRMFLIPIR